jgi:hypothetical protein
VRAARDFISPEAAGAPIHLHHQRGGSVRGMQDTEADEMNPKFRYVLNMLPR